MKKEDAIEISLEDWVLAGGGAQGESYNHISDNTRMLKLFSEIITPEVVIPELELTTAVKQAGISCPDPGEFVKVGNRYGIIFRRIPNKVSFCRAISNDTSCLSDMARRLAVMALDLHHRSAENTGFQSVTEYFAGILDQLTTLSDQTRKDMEKALRIVREADTKTLLHGDFHYGNAITDGTTDYFIDLGAFGYGNPEWDNSNLYMLSVMGPDEMIFEQYHIHKAEALEFWYEYKKNYYGVNCPSEEEIKKIYAPYCLLRTLFYERDMGPREDFDALRVYFASLMD